MTLFPDYEISIVDEGIGKLVQEIQKAIDAGKPRFQMRIRFNKELSNNDSTRDAISYNLSGINMKITH